VVADAFAGKSRVERHRLVNDALKDAFARGLHALAIKAAAPGE
jgi:BolA protein